MDQTNSPNWVYKVSTGELSNNGTVIGTGYSGNHSSLNNPLDESKINEGPIPEGRYIIGSFIDRPHLGPCSAPLVPLTGNEMYGRGGFYIHGDNASLNHSASDGCIILNLSLREQIRDSGLHQILTVIS